MNTLLCIIVIGLVIRFEWIMVKTMLTPLVDVAVAIFFIFFLCLVIVAELALIVIAPLALAFGYESRQWHVNVARKLVFIGRDKDAESE